MPVNNVTLKLAQKYTDETATGLGAVKGANATIASITDSPGQSVVTFQWTGTDGAVQTAQMSVKDAYGIAVENGFSGTEQEWLDSLHGASTADAVSFDDTKTQLGAVDVQGAIEAAQTNLNQNFLKSSGGGSMNYSEAFGQGQHTWDIDEIKTPADEISFDNSRTSLNSTTVQGAIEEILSLLNGG